MNTLQVLTVDEINKFEASRPEMFANLEISTLQQLIYPLPKNQALNGQLGKAQTLDQVAQILTANGIQFTRSTRKLDTAVFPHAIYAQLAPLKPGEPFIAPGPDKAVANVISAREPAPLAGDEARNVALNAMKRDQVGSIVADRVKGLREKAKIEYQPGFAPGGK